MPGSILEACLATYIPFKNLSKDHTNNKFCVYVLFQQIYHRKTWKNMRNYPANKKYLEWQDQSKMGEITTKLTWFRIDKFKQILKQKLSTEILLFILHLKCIIFLASHYLGFTRLVPLCTLVKNVACVCPGIHLSEAVISKCFLK